MLVYISAHVICCGARTVAGRGWQTVKVIDPLQGKSHQSAMCPWCFKLMISPWCRTPDEATELSLSANAHAAQLSPDDGETHNFWHLSQPPFSSHISFLLWVLPPYCSTATLQLLRVWKVDTPGKKKTPSRIGTSKAMAMWWQWWCGLVW